MIKVVTLMVITGLAIASSAQAGEQTWNHFGVVVTQSDVSRKEAHDICEMHPVQTRVVDGHPSSVPSLFWPEPCETAERQYQESGAKAKFDEIERRDMQSQVDAVKGALAK